MIIIDNNSCYLIAGRSEQLMEVRLSKMSLYDLGPAILTAVTSRAHWHFLWALFLLIWRLFPAKCRDCPSILLLDKEKMHFRWGELTTITSVGYYIVYGMQFKSQIFHQFMDAIMHLICTVILDWCIILANCKFSWANRAGTAPNVPWCVFPGDDATFNIISSNCSEQ